MNAFCHAKYGLVCYGYVLYCLCSAGRITVRCGSGREHLEIVGLVVRIILICINEWVVRVCTGFIWLMLFVFWILWSRWWLRFHKSRDHHSATVGFSRLLYFIASVSFD